MEHAACNVIYVDRRVSKDRYLQEGVHKVEEFAAEWGHGHVTENVGLLLDVFGEGMFPSSLCLVASPRSLRSFPIDIDLLTSRP